jgi:hypothetical protein
VGTSVKISIGVSEVDPKTSWYLQLYVNMYVLAGLVSKQFRDN